MKHRRAKSGQGALAIVLILAAILVVAYIAIPAVQTWINNLWNSLKNITGSNFGFSGVIVFADGTSQTFGDSDLNSMTIEMGDPAKAVASITVNVNAAPTFTGDLTSYSVTGSLTYGYAYFGQGTIPVKLTDTITASGTTWVSGTSKTLLSKTYTAAQLESGMPSEGDKAYVLDWKASITFSCTIDSTPQSKTATASMQLSAIHSTPQLNGVSLTVSNTILYL